MMCSNVKIILKMKYISQKIHTIQNWTNKNLFTQNVVMVFLFQLVAWSIIDIFNWMNIKTKSEWIVIESTFLRSTYSEIYIHLNVSLWFKIKVNN